MCLITETHHKHTTCHETSCVLCAMYYDNVFLSQTQPLGSTAYIILCHDTVGTHAIIMSILIYKDLYNWLLHR